MTKIYSLCVCEQRIDTTGQAGEKNGGLRGIQDLSKRLIQFNDAACLVEAKAARGAQDDFYCGLSLNMTLAIRVLRAAKGLEGLRGLLVGVIQLSERYRVLLHILEIPSLTEIYQISVLERGLWTNRNGRVGHAASIRR